MQLIMQKVIPRLADETNHAAAAIHLAIKNLANLKYGLKRKESQGCRSLLIQQEQT